MLKSAIRFKPNTQKLSLTLNTRAFRRSLFQSAFILISALSFIGTAHADWGGLSSGDKDKAAIGIGLGLIDAVATKSEEKKAKKTALEKVEALDLSNVYNDDDCATHYNEVLTAKQLGSKKAWVKEVKSAVDERCQSVMAANSERRELEQAKARELAEQRAREQQARQAAAELEKQSADKKAYREYREFFETKKSMVPAHALRNWQPIYDANYNKMANASNGLLARAKNAEEMKNAKAFIAMTKEMAHEVSECWHVNMAMSLPDAPKADIAIIAEWMQGNKSRRRPSGYVETMGHVGITCMDAPTNPKYTQ